VTFFSPPRRENFRHRDIDRERSVSGNYDRAVDSIIKRGTQFAEIFDPQARSHAFLFRGVRAEKMGRGAYINLLQLTRVDINISRHLAAAGRAMKARGHHE